MVASLLAWVFLGERPSMLAVVGLITASVGCWLVAAAPTKLLPDEVR
jgi:drug/metabolite transporter (DMT)-like permease